MKAIGVKEKLRTVFQINPATTRQLTFQQFLKQGWEGGGESKKRKQQKHLEHVLGKGWEALSAFWVKTVAVLGPAAIIPKWHQVIYFQWNILLYPKELGWLSRVT